MGYGGSSMKPPGKKPPAKKKTSSKKPAKGSKAMKDKMAALRAKKGKSKK